MKSSSEPLTTGIHQTTERFVGLSQAAYSSLLKWLSEFVSQPHEGIGRPGAVCPFVEPAMKARSLLMRSVEVGTRDPYTRITRVVSHYPQRFFHLDWPAGNRNLQALILLFPALPEPMQPILDRVHTELKPAFIASGLMVGQFYPACQEPALRNNEFKSSQAPVPFMAIRRMAFHDVLALQHRSDWFAEYERRFGHLYRRTSASRVDVSYVDAHRNALKLHGHRATTGDDIRK